MTRRGLLLLATVPPESPQAAIVRKATEHVVAINRWVAAWNEQKPGTVHYPMIEAAEPLGRTFREFESALNKFIRNAG